MICCVYFCPKFHDMLEKTVIFWYNNNVIKIAEKQVSMKIRALYTEIKILLRAIPATVVTLFAVSVVCINLLAN